MRSPRSSGLRTQASRGRTTSEGSGSTNCRVLGAALVAWIAAAVIPVAHAAAPGGSEAAPARDPRAADEASAEAERAFERGEMLEAAEALERAYALDPRPMFLYRRGYVLREAGSCRAAIEAFEAFLAVTTIPEDRKVAQEWIDHCERVLAREPEPGAAPEPAPAPTPVADSPPPRVDRLGIAGVGVGTGLVVLGGALLGSSYAVATGGSPTQTETEYLAREHRTTALSTAGITTMSIGGAVLVAAGIRLGLVASRRRERSRESSARLGVTAGGVLVRF